MHALCNVSRNVSRNFPPPPRPLFARAGLEGLGAAPRPPRRGARAELGLAELAREGAGPALPPGGVPSFDTSAAERGAFSVLGAGFFGGIHFIPRGCVVVVKKQPWRNRAEVFFGPAKPSKSPPGPPSA